MLSFFLLLSQGQGYDKLRFFEESNIFWAPASTASDLYQQLAANKYREIPQHEIQLVKGFFKLHVGIL